MLNIDALILLFSLMIRILCIAFLFLLVSCSKNKDAAPLFELLPASSTGITFNNEVTNTSEFNIFRYRNFYNGGGVAIGDVNNDGKPDIFFTANQHENKLYLNRGNWKFDDASAKAHIQGIHQWHTGVTMVDINADGWLDIYVCNSGNLAGDNRANELYINNHDGTFSESAQQYGLDDKGLGTHAAFFDYDHDGDLDCFVLNNSFRSIESFGNNRNLRDIRGDRGGDRLYRNDSGHFTDVSAEAGIYGSEIGFGLGVTVGDVNNDGWPDLYVSNDFFERDYLYINQQNGTFKEVIEEATGHISAASMGSDMADINNDGALDIFTTDMLPEDDHRLKMTTTFENYDVFNAKLKNDFHHQFTANCLQLNNGDGTFSDIAPLAGVEATDWSWGALDFDFDNDGWKDIFVCNGISKDLTDQDFLAFFSSDVEKQLVMKDGFNFTRFLDRMPSTPLNKYAFLNNHDLTFKNASNALGFTQPSFSNGAAYGDLDGDGDLDLVINNENEIASIYRNRASELHHSKYLRIKLSGRSPNTFAYGSRVTVFANGMQQVGEQMPARGFESSVEPILHFGLGSAKSIDSLVVRWPDNTVQTIINPPIDTLIRLDQKNATGIFTPAVNNITTLFTKVPGSSISGNPVHHENPFIDFNQEPLIPKMLSAEGPKLAVADVNGDKIPDFFIGSSVGDTAKIFLGTKEGKFVQLPQPAFAADRDNEDIGAAFLDADGDGDEDLVVASGGNQYQEGSLNLLPRLYLNNGKGVFSRRLDQWPAITFNASCVRVGDIDGNGSPDIFIGGRSIAGTYGKAPSSHLLLNDGKGNFKDVTSKLAKELGQTGMVTDAVFSDIDQDGKMDLVIVGDWMPVTIFSWNGKALTKSAELQGSSGWWSCVSVTDINQDGKPDIIAGNMGLNSKIRADAKHPASLFVGDFDNNGRSDCLASYYKPDGKSYAFNLRDDVLKQIPSLKKQFLQYAAYAGKSVEEIIGEGRLNNASKLQVQQTQSCIFYNLGANQFNMQPLPLRAQITQMYAIIVKDLDTDGLPDIFMAGNFYGLKPEVGRYDAGYGTTLLQQKDHSWKYMPPQSSGLFVPGEVRDINAFSINNNEYILVSRNNDSLCIFRKPSN